MKIETNFKREHLSTVAFAKNDVLMLEEHRKLREHKLQRSLRLCNLYRTKVKIIFKTFSGSIAAVEAKIWAVGDKYVSIYGGVNIPKSSILDVKLTS